MDSESRENPHTSAWHQLMTELAKEKETLVSLFLSNAPPEKLSEQYAKIDTIKENLKRYSPNDR
jgi:hypothetical protein